jgi:hypothetical protein
MKIVFSSILILLGLNLFAQSQCDLKHMLFHPPAGRIPQPIKSLGNNPQIKCLRGITDTQNFFEALRTCLTKDIYKADYEELDEMLKQIGFTNGIVDNNFTEGSLSYETIPYGTKGMLGYKKDKKIGYVYAELVPENHNGIKGWKVTAPSGCFVYIFTTCGNAFYPEQPCLPCPDCPNVTITSDGDTTEIACKVTPTKKQITVEVWICLHTKTKQGQPQQQQQQQQQQQSSGKVDKFKPFLLTTSKMDIEECTGFSTNYKFIVAPFSTTNVICRDTTINIPLNIQQTGSSSTIAEPNITYLKRVDFCVDKRTFKRLRKKYEMNDQGK